MKSTQLLLMATAFAVIGNVSGFEIFGIKFPEVQQLNVERTPGMPLLDSEPKHLLGTFDSV